MRVRNPSILSSLVALLLAALLSANTVHALQALESADQGRSPRESPSARKHAPSRLSPLTAALKPIFETISVEDGLPENSVTCILQDYLGYMWFGTQEGVARYDGYSMKVYQPGSGDSSRPRDHVVEAMFEDSRRNLWVGAKNGLHRFDRAGETFASYTHDPEDEGTLSSNDVRCIYQDGRGRLWIGTVSGINLLEPGDTTFRRYFVDAVAPNRDHEVGVYAIVEDPASGKLLLGIERKGLWWLDPDNGAISAYPFDSADGVGNTLDHVQALYRSRDGNIWMSSYNRLARLDPGTRRCQQYLEFPIGDDERFVRPRFAYASILEDNIGTLWASFFSGARGIFSVDPKTGSVLEYDLFTSREKDAYENRIFELFEDHSGILWTGTWLCGVKKWDRRKNQFEVIRSNPIGSDDLLETFSFCYDPREELWLSTPRGLYNYDLATGAYTSYLTTVPSLREDRVMVTLLDPSGDVWLGTRNSGIVRLDPRTGAHWAYLHDVSVRQNIVDKKVFTAMFDHEGILWIGTDGFGLYRYDPRRNTLKRFSNSPTDPSSLSQDQVMCIYEDRNGTLWIGTNYGGLNRYNSQTGTFTRYGFNAVLSLFEDDEGNFWVGDYVSGLGLFDRSQGNVLATFGRKAGLLSPSVWAICGGADGNLWMGSDNGLLRFNRRDSRFRRYTRDDGLPDNFLSPFGGIAGRDGTLYFNSLKGVVAFHPNGIADDPVPPKVVISSVLISRGMSESVRYFGATTETEDLILAYDENDIRIDFVGLHFSGPAKNAYRYVLEGLDEHWVEAGNQRTARYTNLDPGRYVFRVTASNKDHVWNSTGASIVIDIRPPWWRTTWAYAAYLIAILSVLSGSWRVQQRRIRLRHEYEMSRFAAAKLQEMDQMKSRFFTNISHEFRTPLTLILGPVRELAQRIKDERARELLDLIQGNAARLLRLVNQLLSISKIESGKMELSLSSHNITSLVRSVCLSFAPHAERKGIHLTTVVPECDIVADIDREKFETILTNIVSNAFKFTPEGGNVELTLGFVDNTVSVHVRDTGIGIPKEKLPKIFDRFYQVDGSQTRADEGTGIGLSLSKELAELHGGTIIVDSAEGEGTTASITIPAEGTMLVRKDEIEPGTVLEREVQNDITPEKPAERGDRERRFDAVSGREMPSVLVIEDNTEVRSYVRMILADEFRLLEAVDGVDGWNKALEYLPDLIVSDVMMPRLDGFGLCERLKTDERTSHIPVMMLTAKATIQDKLTGFGEGADAYLVKPFEPEELKGRIDNLIEQRKRLQAHFLKYGSAGLNDANLISVDRKFLQRVFSIITEHLSDPSFHVEALAHQAALSRSVLHRKLVALTGEPPVELIRRMRLTRASELIKNKCGNMTEISLEVGFTNPSYFSECFRKQFGVPPSQYVPGSSQA